MVMKRLFAIVFTLLVFCGCEKETLLTVDQTSINISDAGGSQTVTLTTNKPWSVSSTQSWCKVSPSGGEEAAGSRISISCDANTTYDARTCTVTFTCAEITKSVTVSQATNNGLQVSQTTYEVTKAAQQLNIEVKANVKFSVEVDNGCKDWVKYNTTKALTTSTVILDIAENKSYDGREGKVTIKQDGGSLSSTITIKQSQLDGLFLTTSEYNLSNEKHTLTVEVSTNVEFDVKPEADWVKYIQTKGLRTKQIVLEVAENDTYDQRETKVNVKQKNGDLSGTITIKQDEKYGILVSQSEYNLTNEAQTIEVEVKYNVDFEVSIPDGCKDWIKQVSTKGLSTKNYTFSIAKNETYDNREGSITFKQKKGSLSGTVAIKQAQTDYLEVVKNEYTVDIEGETITIEVTSNVDYVVSISEDAQSWLSKVETKGLSKDNVQIAVAAGDDNTDRKGEIVIRYGDLKRTIKVHQYSYAANTNIEFADEKVKAKLVEAFDTNKDGELSIKEAREVKSIEGVFGAIKTYKSFDEFQYFTGVTSIPDEMFKEWRLSSIILPHNIKYIGKNAFYNCTALSSPIIIPEGVETIESYCFYGCEKLPELQLPNSIKVIKIEAFGGCTSITSLVLPETINDIESRAFSNCNGLTSIVIPGNLTNLGYGIFYCCQNLSSVIIEEGIETISEIYNNHLLSMGVAGCFEGCERLETVILPNSLKIIGGKVFKGCKSLKTIKLPNNLSELHQAAFYMCSSLESIVIPESVTEIRGSFYVGNTMIADGAFSYCSSLQSINLPSQLTKIEDRVFFECSNLKEISIPQLVSSIKGQAFYGCSQLKSVVIPESVSYVGYDAFYNCVNLTDVSLPESITTLYQGTFYNCKNLNTVVIPESIVTLSEYEYDSSGAGCFENCTNLETIVIPNSVNSISFSCFKGCTGLKNIQLPESLSSLGNNVFMNCTNIETITLPQGITDIGTSCFEGCVNLRNINIPSHLTTLGFDVFRDCINITSLILPDTVVSIEPGVFWGCTKLSSINLPSKLTFIPRGLFYNCRALTHIEIPESVTTIEGYFANTSDTRWKYGGAFQNCENLTSIIIPQNVSEIGGYSFYGCTKLESITMLPITPPSVEGKYIYTIFGSITNPIFVPKESLEAYNNSIWASNYRIEGIPTD